VTPLVSNAILRAQSDERLVALARDGHERAFEALIERYRKPLMRHVRRVLPESRAEDALQQAFLNAWTALERGVEVREPRAWLYRVAHNAALNALRSPGYDYAELRDSLRSPHTGPDEDHERRWVIGRTLASVAALPENQREALLRTAVEGRSQEQVAAELGLSEGAVRGLVYRARTTLRAAVTAVTPSPLIGWAVAMASGGMPGSTAERIAQLAAGGGTASFGAALAKAGAVVAVTGLVATGAVTVRDQGGGRSGEDKAEAETVGSHSDGASLVPTVAGQVTGAAPGAGHSDDHGLGRRGGSERHGNNGHGPAGKDHGHVGDQGRGNPHGTRNDASVSHGQSGESHGIPGEKRIESSGGRRPDSSGPGPSGSSGSGHDGGTTTGEHSGSSGPDGGGSPNSGPGGGSEPSGGGSPNSGPGDGGGTTTTSTDGHGGSDSSGPGPGTITAPSVSGDGSSGSGSNDTVTTPTS
jgi:RNA polymerase sigma factor (sigma-70 family)